MNDPKTGHQGSTGTSLTTVTQNKKAAARTARTRVVTGGNITLPDPEKPFLERMVTGTRPTSQISSLEADSGYAEAVLSSVAVNIEAGVRYLECQEGTLAKIGGKLSEIAALLTASRSPLAAEPGLRDLQVRFEVARNDIREISMETYGQAALFAVEETSPVVVAVPAAGEWEGLALDRANLGTPGMIAIETGKIHGHAPGLCLDEGSVRRALDDWRRLCLSNRLQWGLLTERLHRIKRRQRMVAMGESWSVPPSPESMGNDGVRRPHLSN